LLIACPYFVLERIDLVPESIWQLNASSETWLLVLDGHARVGPISLSTGETAFWTPTGPPFRLAPTASAGLSPIWAPSPGKAC
jgi:mannose-6-phosphate isomerase